MAQSPEERYSADPPAPTAATLHETVRYLFDEMLRRAWQGTKGLADADLNADPGKGSMSVGQLLKHQSALIRMMTENMRPGATADIPDADIGKLGDWKLEAILAQRERLAERFRETLARVPPETFMEKRPGMKPEKWANWPMLARFGRLLTDLAHHTGQVAYARRQLGKPV